jgi:proline iminopeptidase
MADTALPLRETSVTTESSKIFVRILGNEDADNVIINIHGGPGFSHRYLLSLDQLANAQFMVVDYDQRACGRSSVSVPLEGETLERYVEVFSPMNHVQDLEAVRRAVAGQKKVHILGHSWGGYIAMRYATEYPEHISSLLLLGNVPPTSVGLKAGWSRLEARVRRLQEQGFIPEELSKDRDKWLQQVLPVYFYDPTFPVSLDLEVAPAVAARSTMDAIEDYDLREQAAKLDLPLLILFGDSEPFGIEWAKETQAAFLNAKVDLVVVPNCGHIGWTEQPEIFFRSVHDFFSSTHDDSLLRALQGIESAYFCYPVA